MIASTTQQPFENAVMDVAMHQCTRLPLRESVPLMLLRCAETGDACAVTHHDTGQRKH
jgi:hypothetical protein